MSQINEVVSDIVFHFTYFGSLLNILKQNSFHASTNIGSSADLSTSGGKFFFFSTTRSRGADGSGAGFGRRSVKLVLDGRKLNQKYKGFAIDYWNFSTKRSDYENDYDHINAMKGNELEDRVVLDSPTIPNAASYILEIHILASKRDTIRKDVLDNIMSYTKQYNIPIYFYTDKNYYFNQVKGKAIDPYSVYGWDEDEPYVGRDATDKLWGVDRALYLLMHNDNSNREKILNYFRFSEEEWEKLEEGLKKETYNYLMPNAAYDYEYYRVISSEIHNMRSKTDDKYKFVMQMLADDLRKYNVKTLKDYVNLKTSGKKLNMGKKLNESITDKLVSRAKLLYEEVDDIPYAEEVPYGGENDLQSGIVECTRLIQVVENFINNMVGRVFNNVTISSIYNNPSEHMTMLKDITNMKNKVVGTYDRYYNVIDGYDKDFGIGKIPQNIQRNYDALDRLVTGLDNKGMDIDSIGEILGDMVDKVKHMSKYNPHLLQIKNNSIDNI